MDWETYPSGILQLHLWPKLPGTCHMYHPLFAPASARSWCTLASDELATSLGWPFWSCISSSIIMWKKLTGVHTQWQPCHRTSFPTLESNFEAYQSWRSGTPWIFSRHPGSVRTGVMGKVWWSSVWFDFCSPHKFQVLQMCKMKLLIYQLVYLCPLALGLWGCKRHGLRFVSPGLVRFQHGKHWATEVSFGLTTGLAGIGTYFSYIIHISWLFRNEVLARSIKLLWSAQIENLKCGLLLLLMQFFVWRGFRFLSRLLDRDPKLLFSIVFISPVTVESRDEKYR